MINFRHSQLWVQDQDEAVAFYTDKLGWEVKADVTLPEMGDFRWLVVGPRDQAETSVVLMAIPGPPMIDEDTAAQVRDLVAKGVGGTLFLTTEDVHATAAELASRGVEFTDQPEERPYGIDAGLRDPSGNAIRLTQPIERFA